MDLFTPDMSAIVTGGTQGVGFAVARAMIEGGIGRVAIVGRNEHKGRTAAETLGAQGADILFVAADLEGAGSPERIVAEASHRFGPIHALVNAAALPSRDSVFDPDPELFDRIMATNVRAPMLLTSLVVENMAEHEIEGSIVNIGSVAGHGGPPFLASYVASKGALMALTKNHAAALASRRIRVNIVNPGWMNTPAEDEIQRRFHGATDGWQEEAASAQPFGRLIEPQEIARLIAFLASPRAGMITGAVIDYDQHVTGAGPHADHPVS